MRRAEVQLGDTACVIGLGLVGQLVVRLLVASGVRVTGLDVLEERCRAAEKAGADLCAAPTDEGIDAVQQALGEIVGGRGADHLFLAAGGSSNGPVEAAARLARDRAHVVDIGKTRLDLPWNAYYDKELDVRFSRSYGPGRYDDRYELDGIDYPAGYVRWTERRNLECFLDLIARKEIEVETLISGRFPLDQASTVYADHGLGLGERGGRAARVPRARRGRAPAGDQPGRLESGARRPQRHLGAAGDRLHRRRQLRVLDAAAEPGQAGQRLPVARRDHAVPVRGQRPAPFRVHDRVHDRGRGPRGQVAGRHLHRDPASHARGHGLPGAGDGEGRLRREAARADRKRPRAGHRRHREDRQRPAHGGLQPPVRAAARQDAVASSASRTTRPPAT